VLSATVDSGELTIEFEVTPISGKDIDPNASLTFDIVFDSNI